MREWAFFMAFIIAAVYVIFMAGVLAGRADLREQLERQGYVVLGVRSRELLKAIKKRAGRSR